MITCPSCSRSVFNRSDMLYATLSGALRCPACGRIARIDVSTRWMMSCVIAVILPNVLLYGGVFYSGHLFLISIFVILGTWATMSWLASPLLKLEVVARSSVIDRRKSIFVLIVMLISALIIDSYIRTRID